MILHLQNLDMETLMFERDLKKETLTFKNNTVRYII